MEPLKTDQGSYLGRIVGMGLTSDGNPLLLYGVSGRSEPSKQRRAYPDIHAGIVRIDPIGELTSEQEAIRDLIIYNAMKLNPTLAVVSNGRQTDEIFDLVTRFHNPNRLLTVLYGMGPEPDKYSTPRIGGAFYNNGAKEGIAFKDEALPAKKRSEIWQVDLGRGRVEFTSTYNGSISNPEPPPHPYTISRRVSGGSAQELAQELYDAIDPNIVVCAVAAVLTDGNWNLAVRNAR